MASANITSVYLYGSTIYGTSKALEFFDFMDCETLEEIDEKFRVVYNSLSTEFRKFASK